MTILSKKKYPEVIDLFSGCGGLALGFKKAGFKITHGIELMENAVKNANFNLSDSVEEGLHIQGDITKLDPQMWLDKIGENGCIVIGGPPCQAYSLVGRGKLNSIRKEGTFLDDKRGYLFEDFLRFAIGLNARAVVMENVKQSTAFGDLNVPEKVSEILEENGYKAIWTILNAADFGVPQVRERVVLIAVKEDVEPVLPTPTHSGKLIPDVVAGTGIKDLAKCPHFRIPKKKRSATPKWVTVGDAIGDLASLHPKATSEYVANAMNALFEYEEDPENDYQRKMRVGMGDAVSANCYRNCKRDFPIFARMQEGDDFVAAADIAEELLKEACLRDGVVEGTNDYDILKAKIVPPYSRDKFLSKWKKLDREKPSHTLVAHLSVDTYSHIHPWEPRGISVREAARLQSFPDNFIFLGSMGDAFKQIGNSVPPLLSEHIARAVIKTLQKAEDAKNEREESSK